MASALALTKTEMLTFGYIRDVQLLLPNLENPYYNIPKEITDLTLSYIYNYFMNTAQYTWQINDVQLIKSLMNYKFGEGFESEIFEMAKLLWRIQIYPRGDVLDRKGYFVINIKPLSFGSSWDKIIFCRNIEFLEEYYTDIIISSRSHDQPSGVLLRTFKLSQLTHHLTITIRITVNILAILLKSPANNFNQHQTNVSVEEYPKIQHVSYKIDEALLKILKAKPNDFYHSSGTIDNMWNFEIYINGDRGNDGYISMYLRQCLCLSNLTVNYKIVCEETGDHFEHSHVIYSLQDQSWGVDNWFESSKLADIKALTLSADIEIQEIQQKEHDYKEITDQVQITDILLQSKEETKVQKLESLAMNDTTSSVKLEKKHLTSSVTDQ